jgi:photosystem II stability/assembly factor-like uncharacterized protein
VDSAQNSVILPPLPQPVTRGAFAGGTIAPPHAQDQADREPPQIEANAEANNARQSFASPPVRQAFSAPAARALKKSPTPAVLWNIDGGSVQRSSDNGKTWQAVPVSDETSFHALASAGPEIWAGGSNGALFHSSDGGHRWQSVRVRHENALLSGAIISINAQTSPRIEITTDSGEHWISEDRGLDWRRIR